MTRAERPSGAARARTRRLAAAALAVGHLACGPGGGAPDPPAGAGGGLFDERAEELGLVFHHFNGMSGAFYLPEITGAGGAFLDYDNDGDLDVFLVQGAMLGPGKTVADAIFPPRHAEPLTDRLFRNDLRRAPDGTSTPVFVDVTATSGIDFRGYGMGVATGDFDGDGWVDLYVTNFGPNRLWRNLGNGTFADATATAGVDDPRWSVPAAFVDYDRDGLLDLFVGNYVDFRFAIHRVCTAASGAEDYCAPTVYGPVPDRLFRNRGGGRFEDVTASAGLLARYGNALGVIPTDVDGDGWIDLYVANDGTPNQLWMNLGDGTFRDEALLRGCAVNMQGRAEASMGVDAGDFDVDGDEDLFMTHLRNETNTLYANRGDGMFDDVSITVELAAPSGSFTGFGTGWFDFDLDGWLDVLVVNGAVQSLEHLVLEGDPYPLHQRDQLFRNLGDGRFREVGEDAGIQFTRSEVGRGAAFGDVDNDGDVDVLVVNNNGPARLLVNKTLARGGWIGIRATDLDGKRDMLGALVGIIRDGAAPLWRRVRTAGSYASARDPRIVFGLGTATRILEIRVLWPDGSLEAWDDPGIGRYHTLVKGSGRPSAGP